MTSGDAEAVYIPPPRRVTNNHDPLYTHSPRRCRIVVYWREVYTSYPVSTWLTTSPLARASAAQPRASSSPGRAALAARAFRSGSSGLPAQTRCPQAACNTPCGPRRASRIHPSQWSRIRREARAETYLENRSSGLFLLGGATRDTHLCAGTGHDERKGELAAILVLDADDARVYDVYVVEQVALELRGCDLEAAYFDELLYGGQNQRMYSGEWRGRTCLDTVDNEDFLLLVDHDLVAGM